MSEKRETQDISSNKISRNIPCMGTAIDNAAEDCAWKAAETGELSSQTISSKKVGEKIMIFGFILVILSGFFLSIVW